MNREEYIYLPDKMLIGRLEGKLQLVKKMLDSGIELNAITTLIDLSLEKVTGVQHYVN